MQLGLETIPSISQLYAHLQRPMFRQQVLREQRLAEQTHAASLSLRCELWVALAHKRMWTSETASEKVAGGHGEGPAGLSGLSLGGSSLLRFKTFGAAPRANGNE